MATFLRLAAGVASVCALAASSGCRVAGDLLPRTHTVAASPDHRYRAFVRQHLNPDPPDDHLYLGPQPGVARELMALAPDRDWCREIVWSTDSRQVGFLVNDRRLVVFDAASRHLAAVVALFPEDAGRDAEEARRLTLDGSAVSFDRVRRPTMMLTTRHTQETFEVSVSRFGSFGRPLREPGRDLGRVTLPLGKPPLLRVISERTGRAPDRMWITYKALDGREATAPLYAGPDGVALAPAFNAVALRRIEIVTSAGGAVLASPDLEANPVDVRIRAASGSRIAHNAR